MGLVCMSSSQSICSYANFQVPFKTKLATSKGFLFQHTDIPLNARKQVETNRKMQLDNNNADFDYEADPLSAKICFENYNSEDKKIVFKILQIEDPGVPGWIENVARNPDWQLHDEFWENYMTDPYFDIPGMEYSPYNQAIHFNDHIPASAERIIHTNKSTKEKAEVQAHLATHKIQVSVEYIKRKLLMGMIAIDDRKNIEKRDRNLMELLHSKVNYRGMFYSFLICLIACLSATIIKMFFHSGIRKPSA